MPVTPENQQKLLDSTRESAAAFVEDMEHIREVLTRTDPVRGELRRLSAILRRLIVDSEISLIAGPRIGKFNFEAPDNTPVYEAEKGRPYTFFGSGGVMVFGIYMRAAMVEPGSKPRDLKEFHPEQTIYLRLDKFQTQRVLALNGKWATRGDAISYIANVASGVHSGTAKKPEQVLLSRIRRSANYSARQGAAGLSFNLDAAMLESTDFLYTPDAIDPVLLELLAAAKFLATSVDASRLEAAIRSELNLPPYLPPAAKPHLNWRKRASPKAVDLLKQAARRIFHDDKRIPPLSPTGTLKDFRFTTVGTDDVVFTVNTDNGDQLQARVPDDKLIQLAMHFPMYVNGLMRHRTLGQGADRDVQVRATPEPLSYEISEDMYTGRVILGIEWPKGMKSLWSMELDAARSIGRQLIERAAKISKNTHVIRR